MNIQRSFVRTDAVFDAIQLWVDEFTRNLFFFFLVITPSDVDLLSEWHFSDCSSLRTPPNPHKTPPALALLKLSMMTPTQGFNPWMLFFSTAVWASV